MQPYWNKLIELVEVTRVDGITHQQLCDVYEVYEGDWVKVVSLSANGYWHTYEYWEKNLSEYTPEDRRYIMVLRDGAYVGHWEKIEDFYHFVTYYLRGTIVEKIDCRNQP